MNEQETHEEVVKLARRELEGHERINCWVRPEFVRALIDRLEAAHKRERGNFAALREALKAIGGLCDRLIPTWDGAVGRIKDITEAALAVRARNCDVGTAEEQSRRCFAYCNQYICKDCPCNTIGRCTLVWAQLPYEEGGAK